jgi:hypothetical protein
LNILKRTKYLNKNKSKIGEGSLGRRSMDATFGSARESPFWREGTVSSVKDQGDEVTTTFVVVFPWPLFEL